MVGLRLRLMSPSSTFCVERVDGAADDDDDVDGARDCRRLSVCDLEMGC